MLASPAPMRVEPRLRLRQRPPQRGGGSLFSGVRGATSREHGACIVLAPRPARADPECRVLREVRRSDYGLRDPEPMSAGSAPLCSGRWASVTVSVDDARQVAIRSTGAGSRCTRDDGRGRPSVSGRGGRRQPLCMFPRCRLSLAHARPGSYSAASTGGRRARRRRRGGPPRPARIPCRSPRRGTCPLSQS